MTSWEKTTSKLPSANGSASAGASTMPGRRAAAWRGDRRIDLDAGHARAEAAELLGVHPHPAAGIQDGRAVKPGPLSHQRQAPLLPRAPNVGRMAAVCGLIGGAPEILVLAAVTNNAPHFHPLTGSTFRMYNPVMFVAEIIWLPDVLDKLDCKHGVSPAEVEISFLDAHCSARCNVGMFLAKMCTPLLDAPMYERR